MKKITISDIAKLSGVSKTTVSFYLNGKYEKMSKDTYERIKSVIEKTNYHPNVLARSLNDKQTKLIGVIIGDIANSFANQIVKGIENYINEHGYQMIVGASGYSAEKEKKCLKSMFSMGVDGFIVQPTVQFDAMWQESGINKPIVYFDSPSSSGNSLWVKANNYDVVYDATEELVEKGYDQFLIVTADPYVLKTRMERCKGLMDCLDIKKIPYDMLLADINTSAEDIKKRILPYLSKEKSTCVFVGNNWLLDKVYLALREYKNQIPNEIGIIGFDSLEWSELAIPSITTIVQPTYKEGEEAAKILIDRIEEKNEELPNKILECRINYLDSTRKS